MSPLEAARGGFNEGGGAANDEKERMGTIEEQWRFVNVLTSDLNALYFAARYNRRWWTRGRFRLSKHIECALKKPVEAMVTKSNNLSYCLFRLFSPANAPCRSPDAARSFIRALASRSFLFDSHSACRSKLSWLVFAASALNFSVSAFKRSISACCVGSLAPEHPNRAIARMTGKTFLMSRTPLLN